MSPGEIGTCVFVPSMITGQEREREHLISGYCKKVLPLVENLIIFRKEMFKSIGDNLKGLNYKTLNDHGIDQKIRVLGG